MQALKGLVIGMGLLIVLGLGIVVYGIYQKASNPNFRFFKPDEPAAAVSTPVSIDQTGPAIAFGETLIAIPSGSRVNQVTPAGNRLIVTVTTAQGEDIIIIVDLNTGQRLGQISLIPRP